MEDEFDATFCQIQDMTEWNEITRPLTPHDAGNAGHAENIAFFHGTGLDGVITVTAHGNTAAGHGRTSCYGFAADVDHDSIAFAVNMSKFVHQTTYFPNPQFGKVQTGQLRQRPPSPRLAKSSAVTGISAMSDGKTRSKIVRFAYMTQPGRPTMGRPSPA